MVSRAHAVEQRRVLETTPVRHPTRLMSYDDNEPLLDPNDPMMHEGAN